MAESDNGRVKINKDIQRSLIETGLVIKEENIKKHQIILEYQIEH